MKIRLITLTIGLLPFNISQLSAEELNLVAHNVVQEGGEPVRLLLDRTMLAENVSEAPKAKDEKKDERAEGAKKAKDSKRQNVVIENTPVQSIKLRMSPAIADFEPLNGVTEGVGNLGESNTPDSPDAIVIQGDKMQVYQDRQYTTTGNAALLKQGQNIYGDTINYDVENGQLNVVGNSKIVAKESVVDGSELHMRLDDNVGEMKDAAFAMSTPARGLVRSAQAKTVTLYNDISENNQSLTQQNIDDNSSVNSPLDGSVKSRGDADVILFEGQNRKRLKNARITTCEVGNDDWYIKSSDLQLDDYTKTGTGRNARVEFKSVPILYTPWIRFPYSNQRKSGFLAPTIGTTTKSGLEMLAPYYWNISPDMDATLATRYLSKRGIQLQGEFRYLGESYSGINSLEYLNNDDETDKTRFYIKLKHQQALSNGVSFSYDYSKVSDNQYFSDMTSRIITTSLVNLPQQATVSYSYGGWGFNALVQKYQTLDNASFPYARLPQITAATDQDFGAFNFKMNNQFVRFDTDVNAPQTLVKGNRFSAYPSVSLPYALPFGYITPKIGVSYTNYDLTNVTPNGLDANSTRTLPIFSLDTGIFFDRKTKIGNNSYTQTLEPRLFYVYIPYQDQSKMPVFDSALADLNLGTLFLENQYVGGDRINNANQLSMAVTSRLFDANTGVQRLAATLGQRFYFTEQKVGLPNEALRTGDSSDIVSAVTARLRNNWSMDSAFQYNTSGNDIVKANIGTRYNPEPGKVLNLSYRYTKAQPSLTSIGALNQVNVSGQWPLGKGYYGVGRYNYSLEDKQPIEVLAGIEYDASCWKTRAVMQRLTTTTGDANYAFFLQLELDGLASVGSNPMTLLSREIPGYSKNIPDAYRQENRE